MYRAEGNANLILALPETRQVLRLKKVAKEDPAVDANENFLMLKSVVRYIRRISALFHQDFVTSPRLVILLSLKDMDAFNKQLNQYRPGETHSECADELFFIVIVYNFQLIDCPRRSASRSESSIRM